MPGKIFQLYQQPKKFWVTVRRWGIRVQIGSASVWYQLSLTKGIVVGGGGGMTDGMRWLVGGGGERGCWLACGCALHFKFGNLRDISLWYEQANLLSFVIRKNQLFRVLSEVLSVYSTAYFNWLIKKNCFGEKCSLLFGAFKYDRISVGISSTLLIFQPARR